MLFRSSGRITREARLRVQPPCPAERAGGASTDLAGPDETLLLPTLACTYHSECVVYVGGRASYASEQDWNEYMRFIERLKKGRRELRALVLERGFGPTLRQRQQLQAATSDVAVRASILTNSAFARGITVMVALVKPGYKAFAIDAIDGALAHLGIAPEQGPEFAALLRSLEEKLERGRGQPPAAPPY